MGMCVAIGCKNCSGKGITGDTNEKKITFHRFPTNSEFKAKWIRATRRDKWKPSTHSRICSEHFKESDFDRSSPFVVHLKKNVVPSIFPSFPPNLQPTLSKERILVRSPSPPSTPVPHKIQKTDLKIESGKLEETQSKLFECRKKLKNMRQMNKRLMAKVENLTSIVKELEERNEIKQSIINYVANCLNV